MSNILFSQLDISEELQRAIEKMGFEKTTPIQEKSLPHILEGRDVVAQAPTGTGKTCAFGIPLIDGIEEESEKVEALVLCPTRELCIQITEELLKLARYKTGIKIVPIYGGQDYNKQINALKRRPQIIVATPGRLMDHMRRHLIKLDCLEFVVLDEADEMLNMGFREDIDTILETVPEERQTLLFSATISKGILDITKKYQKDAVTLKVERQEINKNAIEQYYLEIKESKKLDVLTRIMDIEEYQFCMVFCNTKRKVEDVTEELQGMGYEADCLHGDMKQAQRDRVMAKFRKRKVNILVATDVAARGLDIDGVEAIFNYDIPIEDEYYIHRIGRTGRADKTGASYTLISSKQRSRLNQIMRYTHAKIAPYRIPDMAEVEARRAQKVFDEVKQVLDNKLHRQYAEIISEYLEENRDLRALDVSAALMYLKRNNGVIDTANASGAIRDKIQGRFGRNDIKDYYNVEKDRRKADARDRNGDASNNRYADKSKDGGGDFERDGDRRTQKSRDFGSGRDSWSFEDGFEAKKDKTDILGKITKIKPGKKASDGTTARLFLNVGALDKMSKSKMVEMFEHHTYIDQRKITGIDVFGKFSFVTIPAAEVEEALDSLNGVKFKGRTVFVEVADKAGSHGSSKPKKKGAALFKSRRK